MNEAVILAAGCVLWRRSGERDGLEIAVVYRPKWGDWSLPKGKAEPGEEARATAVREVFEETGMTCTLGPELPSTRYRDAKGRPKQVRYWSAEATGGAFAPNREVTQLLWLSPPDARNRLTRPMDAELVDALLASLRASGGQR
ncbi:NUDIX hydrolase [Streptomyces sp. CA-132043]|uniref:NUDIX hydrolase n=1 Tax=Streptomyces sp. CA-132043 TaxID=3240048 RepID=UPI003D90D388